MRIGQSQASSNVGEAALRAMCQAVALSAAAADIRLSSVIEGRLTRALLYIRKCYAEFHVNRQ